MMKINSSNSSDFTINKAKDKRKQRLILNTVTSIGFNFTGALFFILSILLSQFFSVATCFYLSILTVIGFVLLIYTYKLPQLPLSQIDTFILDVMIDGFLTQTDENIVAHRGGADEAPENTLISFHEAKSNGAVAVEFDIAMTKDNVAVLLHDSTLDRTTNGSGYISRTTFEETQKLEASSFHPKGLRFPPQKVPTLEDAVEECLRLGLKMYFDVKGYSPELVNQISSLFVKHPRLKEMAIVCSFYPITIYKLRLRNPEILTALTTSDTFIQSEVIEDGMRDWILYPAYFLDIIIKWSIYNWLWYLCGVSAVLLNKDTISRTLVAYWTDRNIRVIPWTVNDPIEKQYFMKYIKVPVITDRVIPS